MIDLNEVTVENFNYSNVKKWIGDYTHAEKVEFAINCAELVIHLYTGSSDAPKKAIEAAKAWLKKPSEENRKACKAAAAAAYAAADSYADSSAAAADSSAAAADSAAADSSAAAADSAAAAAAYAASKSIKEKIIGFITGKHNKDLKPRTKVEYVLCEFSSLSDLVLACENGDSLYLEHVETKERKKTDVYGAISMHRHNDPIYRKVEREVEWYEDIPAGGVLCYVSDALDDYKLVISIAGYKDSLLSKFVDNSGGNWRTATPLTKAEIQKLMDNAPE